MTRRGWALISYRGGKARAMFWRAQGFPNCALARAAKARYRRERLDALEAEKRAATLAGDIENFKQSGLNVKSPKR